jgi:hypothetical protein
VDIDAALTTAREAARTVMTAGDNREFAPAAEELAEAFEIIDGWLIRQGFLPKAWERPNLIVQDKDWKDVDDGKGRHLHTQITINGTFMHLEAYEVDPSEVSYQKTKIGDEDIAAIYDAVGADGPWATTRIPTLRGRDYVIFAAPHCD